MPVNDPNSLIEDLLAHPPSLHADGNGKLVNYQIDVGLVRHLKQWIKPGAHTMETGSGVSTIIFLILGAIHRSVTPFGEEAERIRAYCRQKLIPSDTFTAIMENSETALPKMDGEPILDLALIDGNHAFPVPCIDWYYMTRLLKKGGVLIVDDVQIWSGEILANFLDAEEVWENLERTKRFAVYRLKEDSRTVLKRWWGQQPYLASRYKEPSRWRGRLRRLFSNR
jgi:hypothetical protein